MNKKIIVFLCILSLLVPFLPQFDFVVRAYDPTDVPSASDDFAQWIDDNFYTNNFGVLVPKTQAPLYMKINWALTDAGYVLKDPVSAVVDSLQSATNLQLLTKENVLEYGSTINYDYSTLSNNVVNNSITYAFDNLSSYIYTALPVSDFFNYLYFSNSIGSNRYFVNFKSNLISIVNNADCLCVLHTDPSLLPIHNNNVLMFPSDLLENYSFVLSSGTMGDFHDFPYQIYRTREPNMANQYVSQLTGRLTLFDGSVNYNGSIMGYGNSLDFSGLQPVPNLSMSDYSRYLYTGLVNCPNWGGSSTYQLNQGSVFLVPDSWGNFQFVVYKDPSSMSEFLNGESNVYKFDSKVDLSQYGEDIDYSKLYDIIGSAIRGSDGNVIDAINNAVDNYLQEQIDLLHDINNALNDGTGQSWLRRIYGLLDYNFPLTLQSFDELREAIQNISISGGGSDLTHINRVLDEINDKLGFMIEEPLTNADIEDMNDLKNLASQKFPFCVFSDIVAISVILNQTPEQPHWQIPLKLPGSQSANNIEVDLSWYEEVRPVVQGVFIFIFIVGLLALSVKVFSALKS